MIAIPLDVLNACTTDGLNVIRMTLGPELLGETRFPFVDSVII